MQVVTAMNATHQLGGENYVLWGGREGYESLLNTDLRQSASRLAASCRWWSTSIRLVWRHAVYRAEPQEPTNISTITMSRRVWFQQQFGLEMRSR